MENILNSTLNILNKLTKDGSLIKSICKQQRGICTFIYQTVPRGAGSWDGTGAVAIVSDLNKQSSSICKSVIDVTIYWIVDTSLLTISPYYGVLSDYWKYIFCENSNVRGFIWSSSALHNFLRCHVFRTILPLNHHEFRKW